MKPKVPVKKKSLDQWWDGPWWSEAREKRDAMCGIQTSIINFKDIEVRLHGAYTIDSNAFIIDDIGDTHERKTDSGAPDETDSGAGN